MLEPSNPFSMCIRYRSETTGITPDYAATNYYEQCFRNLFIMDGEINTTAMNYQTGTFVPPGNTLYGSSPMTGTLQFTYPTGGSTQQVDQKAMGRIHGGYSATSPSPISFGSHTLLWYNPLIDLYVFKQPLATGSSAASISLSGLVNPEPYQKEDYELVNTLQMTYYDDYHPTTQVDYVQPDYTTFQIYSSLVKLSTLFVNDIKVQIPVNTPYLATLTVLTSESISELTRKLTDHFEVEFTSGVAGL